MTNPLVSAIMPCFEQEAYVRDALRSVMAQTYRPLEILVSDDASTDRTHEVVQDELSGAKCPHRVAVNRNSRRRGIENYNVLMSAAKGALVVHAHGDDISYPNRVERLVEQWQRTGVSLVSSNAVTIDEASRRTGIAFDPEMEADCSAETLIRIGRCPSMIGAALAYEREVFDWFGEFDRRRSLIRTDAIIPFRAALLKGHSVIAEPLLEFRKHQSAARDMVRPADVPDGPIWEERRAAEAAGQLLYMLDALTRARKRDPENQRLAKINIALRNQVIRRSREWSMARNRLIDEGFRLQWTKPDPAGQTR